MKAASGIVTTIVIIALVVALAMPAQAGAKTKTRKPKLNKTKVTLAITEKKNKPAVRLKVKYASGKVKWKTSNKRTATVSKKGTVTALKKGTAIIKAKIGRKTLKCKVIVKDKRKRTAKTVPHKHNYVKDSWYDPQCDLEGKIYYSCSICHKKYVEVLPALEHNYIYVSEGIESFTGKSFIKYQCTKCDRWYTQYPGPRIDYKKPHIHCHCGMDFNDSDAYSWHCLYAELAGETNGHSCYNWLCCLV